MDAVKEELYSYLSNCISDNKRKKFEEISALRTRHVTVVLEDIYQPQNASAVLRTSECLGLQDVHIIENRNKYNLNPDVVMGSSKWINIHRYRGEEKNTSECLRSLKNKGYRIVATTPHTDDVTIDKLDVAKGKIALIFGTEIEGLSSEAMSHADEFVRIPMYGFTESFNISVSAAICLYSIVERLRQEPETLWKLSDEELLEIKLQWARNNLYRPELIEKEFYKNRVRSEE